VRAGVYSVDSTTHGLTRGTPTRIMWCAVGNGQLRVRLPDSCSRAAGGARRGGEQCAAVARWTGPGARDRPHPGHPPAGNTLVLGLVARPRLPPQAFGVHACDRARARLATQLPQVDEPLAVREASPPSERRQQYDGADAGDVSRALRALRLRSDFYQKWCVMT
jgi:hypothetical protein